MPTLDLLHTRSTPPPQTSAPVSLVMLVFFAAPSKWTQLLSVIYANAKVSIMNAAPSLICWLAFTWRSLPPSTRRSRTHHCMCGSLDTKLSDSLAKSSQLIQCWCHKSSLRPGDRSPIMGLAVDTSHAKAYQRLLPSRYRGQLASHPLSSQRCVTTTQ